MKKRTASLSATLVMLIIIIMISTYVMKWVFDRYTTATRFYRSSISTVGAEGVMLNRVSCCVYGTGCQTSVGGKPVSISINCSASNAQTATFTINED